MSGDHWERVQLLFDELLELDTGRRRARLELLSRTDPGLSDELRSLIGAHERAGDFLGLLGAPSADPTPTSEPAPSIVGTYTLLREIGRGGMGRVYLAHDARLNRHGRDDATDRFSGPPWSPKHLRSLLVGGLLLGGLALFSAIAGAQRVEPATGSPPANPAIDTLEEQAAARVAAAVCSKRVVLLGELPEHGEARGFGVKARIVRRLVASCGFRAVLFEAGSYDFLGLEAAISTRAAAPAGAGSADSLELALARAIGGLWWTRELAGWRRWLVNEAMAGRVKLGGIDDQLSATAAYARATLPGLVGAAAPPAGAAECQQAVARYLVWGYTTTLPYDSTERTRLADCARLAADRALAARTSAARTPDELMLDNLASHFARERGTGERAAAATADRDLVMARNFEWWSARLPNDTKIVVWTATVHAARAPGPQPVLPDGVPPLGARLAERWGERMAVIGFTALQGHWSRPGRLNQPLAALPPDALEARALAGGARGDSAGWAYLDRAMLRSLGPVPSRLLGRIMTTDWSTVFDGVLVIRNEAGPTFEPRR